MPVSTYEAMFLLPSELAFGTEATPEAMQRAFAQNLLVRVTGDIIALSPPLIISEAQIGEIAEKVAKVIRAVA